jgi:hypothetical protein
MKLYKEVDASKYPEKYGWYYTNLGRKWFWPNAWFNTEDMNMGENIAYVQTWLKPTTLAEIIKDRITEEEIENILFRHRQSLDKGFYLKAAKAIMELITDKD